MARIKDGTERMHKMAACQFPLSAVGSGDRTLCVATPADADGTVALLPLAAPGPGVIYCTCGLSLEKCIPARSR